MSNSCSKSTTIARCIAAMFAISSVPVIAQIDEIQARLLKQYELPLRWDNVAPRAPYWERGSRPDWRRDIGLHVIHLAPGESVTVRVPATETLRVRQPYISPPRDTDTSPPFSISLSNGTGLHVEQRLRISEDKRDWLVEAGIGGPQLARIVRPATANGAIDIAVFVSRREPLSQVAPYRGLTPLPGRAVNLRRGTEGAGQQYWPLASAVPAEVTVEGPARYAVQSRLRYAADESALPQRWRIETRLDGAPFSMLSYESSAENAYPTFVNGAVAVLTGEKESYLEIPAGKHRLELVANATLLTRLLKQEDPDYLAPNHNEPSVPARKARADSNENTAAAFRRSGWRQFAKSAAVVNDPNVSPAVTHEAAQRLLEDNHVRDASIVAAAVTQQSAQRNRNYPEVRTDADEILGLYTFYRDLLPQDKLHRGDLRVAWYLTPRLYNIGEQGRGATAATQHESALLGWMDAGLFLPVPGIAESANTTDDKKTNNSKPGKNSAMVAPVQTYVLPERFSPSWLRIVVHSSSDAVGERLYVQFDDAPPTLLNVSQFPDLPGKRFMPSSSEVGLRMQQEQHGEYGVGTLSGAFSRRFTPAPLIGAGLLEMPLPREVRQIKLWRERADGPPIWAALKYATAKPHQLTERAYRAAVVNLGKSAEEGGLTFAEFKTALGNIQSDDAQPAQRELDSHWQPLARLIRTEAKVFAMSVTPSSDTKPNGPPAAAAIAQANSLASRGQWLAALELWSVAANSAIASEREQALFGRVTALQQVGEEFLAEQLLKQEMLHGMSAESRTRAREALVVNYRRANDSESLKAIYATALLHNSEKEAQGITTGLISALLDSGESDAALTAGLLLPRQQRPVELLVRAAYALQWWATFEDLLNDLPDESRRDYWHAHRQLSEGRYADAEAAFRRAGTEGIAFADHIQRAQEIHRQLTQSKAAPDAAAIAAWGEWSANHPGPRRWQDAGSLVTDFAGAQSLYSIDRDTYLNTFRTSPGQPLRLRVLGPTRLRIEARPIHSTTGNSLIEGWLRIKTGANLWHAPITQNSPTSGLTMTGQPNELPGRKVMQEIELGAGWHEMEADGEQLPLLLRVEIQQPELFVGILPRLTPETATARSVGVNATSAAAWGLGGCNDCSVLVDNTKQKPQTQYVRLERNLIDANPTSLVNQNRPAQQPSQPIATAQSSDAALRADGRWNELLAWPADRSDAALLERVTSLLWVAEHQPEHYPTALALAQAIQAEHPTIPGIESIVDRLGRNSTWTPIEIVQKSAGLRAREIAEWDPEAPSLRARRALLAPTGTNEHMLAGGNRLVVSFVNPRPARVEVALAAEDIAALPPQPLIARLQINDAAPQRIVLEGSKASSYRSSVTLPAGRSNVRIWIEQPVADQFLRVRLTEAGRPQFAETTRRFYHVATKTEAVQVSIPGPAWLRIDEWTNNHIESRYRWIDKGWQSVTLEPSEGQKESLYRLHLRSVMRDKPVTPPRATSVTAEPLPTPPRIMERPLADPVRIVDALPLADSLPVIDSLPFRGQLSGTWSVSSSLRQRIIGRDDSPEGPRLNSILGEMSNVAPGLSNSLRDFAFSTQREQFIELAVSHHTFSEDSRTYYGADLLTRLRENGGPTFGVRAQASRQPVWTSWNFRLNGDFYIQNPGGDNALNNSRSEFQAADPSRFFGLVLQNTLPSRWEFAGTVAATASQRRDITPKLWHEPTVSTFFRYNSLDENAACSDRCMEIGYGNFVNWARASFPSGSDARSVTRTEFDRLLPRYRPESLDQDVFTPYQSTHRRGVTISDQLNWQPWLDSQPYVGGGVVTKENYDPLHPDYVSANIGWRQLLGNTRANVYWTANRYFANDQRINPTTTQTFAVDLNWEILRTSQDRLEIGFSLRREIDAHASVVGIIANWHFGNGRGFRDFSPQQIDFSELRKRRIALDQNNQMQEEKP
ncbi:MAG: hypothetical protein V4568_09040 [Pseudomonadota bacterium]